MKQQRRISPETAERFKASLEVKMSPPALGGGSLPFLPQTEGQLNEFCRSLQTVLREYAPEKEPIVSFEKMNGEVSGFALCIFWKLSPKKQWKEAYTGKTVQNAVVNMMETYWAVGLLLYANITPQTNMLKSGIATPWSLENMEEIDFNRERRSEYIQAFKVLSE